MINEKVMFMAIRWRNSFSCNIKEIDAQHKRMFEISSKLNVLEPICSKIDFQVEILEVIRELKDYSIYHFNYEEKLLQRFDYKGFEEHHREHEAFIEKVLEFEKDNLRLNRPELLRNIIDFLNGWVIGHILKSDMKYKDYLNSNGIY
jgi:hemerythrin